MVGDFVSHAAQKRPRRAADARAADDEQIGVLLLGDGEKRTGGLAASRVRHRLQPLGVCGSRCYRQRDLRIGGA